MSVFVKKNLLSRKLTHNLESLSFFIKSLYFFLTKGNYRLMNILKVLKSTIEKKNS